MKLTIRRNQSAKTGMFGGHKGMTFSLFCKVQISPEDQGLIDKYRVQDHVLFWRSGPDRKPLPGITVGSLTRGSTQEVDSVVTLLENEEKIKAACQGFRALLEVMATFGGEEIIEIGPSSHKEAGSHDLRN